MSVRAAIVGKVGVGAVWFEGSTDSGGCSKRENAAMRSLVSRTSARRRPRRLRTAAAIAVVTGACAIAGCSRERSEPVIQAGPPIPGIAAKSEDEGREKELRPVDSDEVTPAIERRASEILSEHAHDPLGTEVPFEIEGRSYVAKIEQHYHEPGGPRRPWGHHRGVTVYHAR